jgi:Flp pilus assembly protein TadG
MRMRRQRGNSLLETALFVPVLILLLVGMVELARITYTYYTLHKTLYTLARYLGTQQNVNFCDSGDAAVVAAKNWALTGSTDNSTDTVLTGLTPDMIQIRVERYNVDTQDLGECACSVTGCDTSTGGQRPDFIVVSIPNGFPIQPNFPYMVTQPILFRPQIRVPFGGT